MSSYSYSQASNKQTDGMMDIGVARVDITPDSPIRLAGFAARGKSETDKVLRRLSAKALAFGTDSQGPSLLITVDLIAIQWYVTSKLVARLSKDLNLNPAQIVICATHSHGSPEVGNLINILQCRGDYPKDFSFNESLLASDQLLHIARYNELLSQKLEEVAFAALKDRKPAFVAWGQGQASFAENRRTVGGVVDHSLPVLRVTNPDGTLRAVLVNYACHGIALGPDVNEIHGDWMGEAQQLIEEKHPEAIAMVAVGCAGDTHPKLQGKMEYLTSYGTEISDNVDKLLASTLHSLTSPPVGNMKWITLPFAKVPTVSELIEFASDTTIKGYYARLALERVLRGESLPTELNYPIQIWNFGDRMIMLNMASEVVVDYSIRLKKELGAERVWINTHSNDVSCYIPSRRVLEEGGYEADASMYWYNKPSPLSENVEETIVNTVHELVPASFKSKK